MIEATQKHLAIFEAEARKWIQRLGLLGWNYYFCIEENSSEASVYWNIQSKAAKIVLPKELHSEDAECLQSLAFHEVCELLLAPVVQRLYEFYSHSYIDELTHDVIRRLENAVFDKEKKEDSADSRDRMFADLMKTAGDPCSR